MPRFGHTAPTPPSLWTQQELTKNARWSFGLYTKISNNRELIRIGMTIAGSCLRQSLKNFCFAGNSSFVYFKHSPVPGSLSPGFQVLSDYLSP